MTSAASTTLPSCTGIAPGTERSASVGKAFIARNAASAPAAITELGEREAARRARRGSASRAATAAPSAMPARKVASMVANA